MKFSKKVLGTAMSLVVLGSQAIPVMAATDPAAGTTGGTANILDYEVETVVVPTALKIALNPNGYAITTKYVEAASYTANTVYYTKSGTTYTKATVADATAFGSGGPYYTASTANDSVVSLNYGIVNKSTGAKNVKVDLKVDAYTPTDNTKKAIEFVDSEAKAQAYSSTNTNGAKSGEHKMYLAVASASALPTANTYVKTSDTTTSGSTKTYYTKSGSTYTKVTSPADANIGDYYEATTAIGTEITAAELSDVTMTKATVGNQAFAEGTTNKADASIAYSLSAATYALKDGEIIDFDTEQDDLSTKLEMSSIGGVAGFTLTGKVNADADWTKADADAITITPTYTITDATGTETAVGTGAYNQVTLGPSLSSTAETVDASNSPINITVNNLGNETISSVINTDGNADLIANGFASISGTTVTISSTYVGYFDSGYVATIKIITSGGTELTFTITKP